ncbi:hypothetical protein TanjilG_06464 [Lupinus angustifolius]|uniref:Uncharacterized protein n=1 Tax=Lupinus angustifolius TaxID=3871 RepID=A0A1J7HYH7_LUPAN|nr:PREDICTED: uncharacterized protein LOC109338769 [Lupinus angustifolius]OIW17779.1 hypothetical protein TanjilG_06464 [Lupinus angustifolius]
METSVKHELLEIPISSSRERRERNDVVSSPPPGELIELSSDSDSDSDVDISSKKRKINDVGVVLPLGFLSPLPPATALPQPQAVLSLPAPNSASALVRSDAIASFASQSNGCKQFWKAGDFDGPPANGFESSTIDYKMTRVLLRKQYMLVALIGNADVNLTSVRWEEGDADATNISMTPLGLEFCSADVRVT